MTTLAEKTETLAVEVSCSMDALSVTLTDGRVVSVPLVWFPRLADASTRQRSDWEFIGGGIGIHWEAIRSREVPVTSTGRKHALIVDRSLPAALDDNGRKSACADSAPG
jgi:hypothetical protein